ncbi:hypothetical protein LZK98_11745 [Sphingomonas cannabina]|uniref:DUF6197 family protein n=1 Tax=Sphingomonas cannabina TaxID=2899123 RepID=UPI001F319E16|nr:hypothetical protein [Sphingomonas cannabina]UIJ43764.1 hypothetical protein LZK98_11745 [Sphingomonas cannabina]
MSALSVADVLERAADLIEPEGKWTQKNGGVRGVCWCASTAIGAAHPDGIALDAQRFFANLISPGGGLAIVRIWCWNDAPERTQAEVVAKLREAAALAREQGK